ncbi:MAG TPA: pyruvate dehydrogenase (acetyl-transferring), homodimeric type [Acidimicrobiales bacterium]|nr:pyruvate dehydrogenase (acetyl-transferring), homodimeric type [Acidimicrobiales bacterium]
MIIDGFVHQLPDTDPTETQEWLDSLDAIVEAHGKTRARFLMSKLLERARELQVGTPATVSTPYVNTIPPEQEPWFPGDELLERRIRAFIRWNAAVMVIKANKHADGIGGHLSTFASSAALYDVGFNHFFRGKDDGSAGDAIYIQGHAAPGAYARAYLEGRLTETQLDNFRQEVGGEGLSSYPHPRLMPDFWEYPTVSMGLGPLNSIYHARFLRYLQNRRIDDTSGTRVWCFIGDGECDEPETLGALTLPAREQLDNLIWVVNCNLQRLDGPVRGNGKVIQELEAVFRGAGWNVIKVVWGSKWDELLARDVDGVLLSKMNTTVDGEFQRYAVESGAYIREHFFGPDPRLRKLVEHLSDDELRTLPRGGHDYRKLYAAYKAATEQGGAPTVILAKTIKGWTLGPDVEGRNATHQIKKMTVDQLRVMRERLFLGDIIPEDALADDKEPPYIRLAEGSVEHTYLTKQRRRLDGPLPQRLTTVKRPIELPEDKAFDEVLAGSGKQAASTTTAFTRLLRNLCRDPKMGSRVVPIIPDEARTFGMDALFKEFKIYAAQGQVYESVDAQLLLSYTEAKDGQLLEEGITEAGSMATFIAAGTSYAHRGVPMVPFFTFYSMFGFQRVGDLIWSAADSRARGFLLGATAGRTTLLGEGLQHQDGHSQLLASTVPTVEAWDPAFAYEMATIIRHGVHQMLVENRDVIHYLTLYNENYVMPAAPEGATEGVLQGLYKWSDAPADRSHRATILFSGTAQGAVRSAQTELAERWDVGAELWSATSYKRLREEALSAERWNRLHPTETPRTPLVTELLGDDGGPVVAVTDFIKAVPDQVGRWVRQPFVPLGTDGFGRSDTRERLRQFFEVDMPQVVVATLWGLAQQGEIKHEVVAEAIAYYGIDIDRPDPRANDL